MPSLVGLMLLGALSLAQDPGPAPQETELGTVEFTAGPAQCSARFYLSGSRPEVLLTLRNETDELLIWETAGSHCWSSHWIVEPVALDGSKVAGAPEVIACGSSLGSWIAAHGKVERTIRPFDSFFSEEEVPPPPPLERWAWCYDFEVPRAARGGAAIRSGGLVLAWSVATGPRVFLEADGDVHLDHFDPFANDPFQRGLGPIAFACGPLRGTALLRYEKDWPVVEWTLTNPLDREVAWSPRGVGSPLNWGFLKLEFNEDGENEDAWRYRPEIRRAHGRFAPDRQCRFAAGETRTGRLAPFSYDPAERDEYQRDRGPQGLQRWHFVLDSTWPCVTEASIEPSFLPTQLHLYWDAAFGFDAELQSCEQFLDGRPFEPYLELNAGFARSASFALGGCEATFIVRTWSAWCEIEVHNVSDKAQYWIPIQIQRAIWLQEPGASARAPSPAREPESWPSTGDPLSPSWMKRIQLGVGESGGDTYFLDQILGKPKEQKVDFSAQWELLIPLALPQAEAPAHARDARRVWLRVKWDPAAGLDVRVHDSWPF